MTSNILRENIDFALEIINNRVPDKIDWKTTTTKLFKFNIVQFLSSYPKMCVLELGAAQGHTTQFISQLAECVYSVDNRAENAQIISDLNLGNVHVICDDIYNKFATRHVDIKCDVAIIDAVHDYDHVMKDIETSLRLGARFLIFDDYGMFPEVKRAVDEFIGKNSCDKQNIGMPPGSIFENTGNKVLQDWEGIICFIGK